MGELIHQRQIDEMVGWFATHTMPDAEPGWEDLPWRVEEMGRKEDHSFWWTIAINIPTSIRGMG